jgi:hypothetical protein
MPTSGPASVSRSMRVDDGGAKGGDLRGGGGMGGGGAAAGASGLSAGLILNEADSTKL